MHLIPVGRHAVLAEVSSPQEAVALAAWARERALAREVVPGAETVLFDGVTDPGDLGGALAGWRPIETDPGPLVDIAVTYDGPDLETVAGHWRCDVEEVVARHQGTGFLSAFCGFSPGFAYLSGLEDLLCHASRPHGPGCRPGPSRSRGPGAVSIPLPHPVGGRSSAPPMTCCGTPAVRSRRCSPRARG